MKKGAYIVSADKEAIDIILVGNGSEVATLIDAAELLRNKKGFKVRVVSVPSEGVFHNQPDEYKQEILPSGIPKIGLTAGLPVTMEGLIGKDGLVIGLEHFGYSAPYNILNREFGFTPESVFEKIVNFLK
jgi:transketolase